jgi:hypothetical protein
MRVPFLDLNRQLETMRDEIDYVVENMNALAGSRQL